MEAQVAAGNGGARDPFFADTFTFSDGFPPDVSANLDQYLDRFMDEEVRRWSRG